MKKAMIGVGLMLCGVIGLSTQRITDTILTANKFTLSHSDFNLLILISFAALIAGIALCVMSLSDEKE